MIALNLCLQRILKKRFVAMHTDKQLGELRRLRRGGSGTISDKNTNKGRNRIYESSRLGENKP
ncbi:MAG: hypothetical protein COZ00_12290 [Zetaproteobacteria bacterium CG_4_10_14_0_8_um_filter_49_80]|nr:MAG: hypothetical protein AUJ56_00915 [Zetaproteobacteria bacterium CG1_02_49_23]PIY54907.1 MAG: hypothetical protein COZ00_12290 [Zetaproteobacteria bacterium CG_4_10_14_0_8_um_filter_49_80]